MMTTMMNKHLRLIRVTLIVDDDWRKGSAPQMSLAKTSRLGSISTYCDLILNQVEISSKFSPLFFKVIYDLKKEIDIVPCSSLTFQNSFLQGLQEEDWSSVACVS